MDQETKERFERIETNLERLSQGHVELNGMQQKLVAAQLTTQKAIDELVISVGRYVDAATERMRIMEANLDAMIRAITADHSNGREKKG